MKQKTFWTVLAVLVAAGMIATVAYAVYTIKSYQTASIISFIAGELW